ncbi:formate dehydrogenase subunit gamma [Steroidobacter denitrificans]|uniref:Formate dehydrogenase subunit gamma n=1 Tax=Steroidobacter denitrificans TaxID=465721 RepID=A0A127FDU3_STEDE|nr:NAD(P)H-dependent oxidoreductase subunit E [Steroidobacter denitrificans]AMN47930.1 formate dehydrogenase subunit gamma [Steroidobacter denitrificans]
MLAEFGDTIELRLLTTTLQQTLGYVPPPAVPLLAEKTGLERAQVFEFIESDAQLSFKPPGRHRVAICLGKNCSQRGAATLAEEAMRTLGIDSFRVTADFAVRLESFYCFGRCKDGPNVLIDEEIHGTMTSAKLTELLRGVLATG